MSDITITRGVRSNLLTLQNISSQRETIQSRLATGKKVNSALDNPSNFFTASALKNRASDLSALMDSMSNGIKTLQAADNGLSAITRTVESMQASVRQARQDKSFKATSFTVDATAIGTSSAKNLTFSGGGVGTTPVNVAVNTLATAASRTGAGGTDLSGADPDLSTHNGRTITLTAGSSTVSYTFTNSATGQKAALLTALGASGFTVSATNAGLNISRADGVNFTAAATDSGGAANSALGTALGLGGASFTSTNGVQASVKTVDQLVADITGNSSLTGKIKATNDNGSLRIENLSTEDLSIVGAASSSATVNGGTGASNTRTLGGNEVRKNAITQFNELRTQLDKLADDAGFNGINLLKADKLKLNFNETGTSSIDIQAKNAAGTARAINTSNLSITTAAAAEFSSDDSLDSRLTALGDALTTLRSQAATFGANLNIVQNRQDFTKAMMSTLNQGADQLTLADTNEEGANLLALNTRAQLATSALSFASQADQQVLSFLR